MSLTFDQIFERCPEAIEYFAKMTSDPKKALEDGRFRSAVMQIVSAALQKDVKPLVQEWQPNQIDEGLLKLSWQLYGKPYRMLKVHELRDVRARYLKLKE